MSTFGGTLIVLLAMAVSTEAQSAPAHHSKVVGGVVANDDSKAAQQTVNLWHNGANFCSGTIISSNLVLTAAHCFGSINPKAAQVVFGANSRRANAPKRDVIKAWIHEEYEGGGNSNNDVAIVQFEGRLPEGYKAAKLPGDFFEFRIGQNVVAAGFGQDREMGGANFTDEKLKMAQFKLKGVTNDTFDLKPNSNQQICFGDSGGSAYAKGADGDIYLVGVTSAIESGSTDDRENFCKEGTEDQRFVRTDVHSTWINNVMQTAAGRLPASTEDDEIEELLASAARGAK